MIRGIDHIELIVRDVEEYVAFFEKMGFKVLTRTSHHGAPEPTANRANAASLPIVTTRAPRAADWRAASTVSGESPHDTATTRQSGPTTAGTTES